MGHPAIDQLGGARVSWRGLIKVGRFVKPVWPKPSGSVHLSQVFNCGRRIDAERQNGSVWSDYCAVFCFHLQRQGRDSVSVIMIMTGVIFCAASTFRNAPRDI